MEDFKIIKFIISSTSLKRIESKCIMDNWIWVVVSRIIFLGNIYGAVVSLISGERERGVYATCLIMYLVTSGI